MKIRKSIAWMLVFGMTIGIFSGQTLYTPKADAAGMVIMLQPAGVRTPIIICLI